MDAASIPESEFRAYAVELAVGNLSQKDPDAAESWLLVLAPDLARDAGLRELADSLLKHTGGNTTDPERAFRLSGQIEHPVIRSDWVEKSLRELIGSNPARSLELIPESGLPAEIRESLNESALKSLKSRGRRLKQRR